MMDNKLKCDAASCVYNYNQLCSANQINVQGADTQSGDNTFCGTYENRGAGSFVSSLGNTNYSGAFNQVTGEKGTMNPTVLCTAKNCTYNEDEKCEADKVNILGSDSPEAKGTECQTFSPQGHGREG